MPEWFPGEMECNRLCYRCINCCDRFEIRGCARDLLHNRRKEIRQRFHVVELRCIDIYDCEKDNITVVDVYWLQEPHLIRNVIEEIIQVLSRYYEYDGCSEIFRNGTKVYETFDIHLFFQFLRW